MLNKQQQCERYLVPAICEPFLSAVLLPFLLSELPSLLLEPFSSRILTVFYNTFGPRPVPVH